MAWLGVTIAVGAGVLMGHVEHQHIRRMSSFLGIAAFALLPFVLYHGLVGAGFALWRSRLDGRESLRVAGWVVSACS